MPDINLNDELKKRHITKQVCLYSSNCLLHWLIGLLQIKVFDPDSVNWECPFCAPPALSFKLPPKDEVDQREHVKNIISTHLQQHRQDLTKALDARFKASVYDDMCYLAGALIRDRIDYRARPNLKKIEHEHHYYGLIPPRLILAQSTTVDTHQVLAFITGSYHKRELYKSYHRDT